MPDWTIKGELILNCNCTVFCPCVVSLGKHPPTEGYCQAWMGMSDESMLTDGDVTVAVEYSTLSYKDGLCLSGTGGGLVRNYPHMPGIDFAGTVAESTDPRY